MIGTLYIISAPSGAGKTSLVSALVKSQSNLCTSISHTSRPQRPGEQDGINYHFISIDAFHDMASAGAFLEHAQVFGNYYGTHEAWVNEQLQKGIDVILEIDWQGAEQVRRRRSDATSVFILPPSKETLYQRLKDRAQDSPDVIARRMAQAEEEMSHFVEYDYLVINDQFDEALAQLKAIITCHRLTLTKQQIAQAPFLERLLNNPCDPSKQ